MFRFDDFSSTEQYVSRAYKKVYQNWKNTTCKINNNSPVFDTWLDRAKFRQVSAIKYWGSK